MPQRFGEGMKPGKSLQAGGAILCLSVLDLGPLAVISNDALLRFVDLHHSRILGTSKLPLNTDSQLAAADIARKGHLCIAAEAQRSEAEVCSVKRRQRLYGV